MINNVGPQTAGASPFPATIPATAEKSVTTPPQQQETAASEVTISPAARQAAGNDVATISANVTEQQPTADNTPPRAEPPSLSPTVQSRHSEQALDLFNANNGIGLNAAQSPVLRDSA